MNFPRITPVLAAAFLLSAPLVFAADQAPVAQAVDPRLVEVRLVEVRLVEVRLVPDKAVVMAGEPFYVSLVVTNHSKHALVLEQGHFPPQAMTRGIQLSAKDAEGRAVPGFDWDRCEAYQVIDVLGVSTLDDLPPGGSGTVRLFVQRWVRFERPGTYTLSAAGVLDLRAKLLPGAAGAAAGEGRRDPISMSVAGVKITVVPVDSAKMDAVADALLKEIQGFSMDAPRGQLARPLVEKRDETYLKLQWIPDARVIPFLQEKLKSEAWTDAYAGRPLYALSRFDNDAALASIEECLADPRADVPGTPTHDGNGARSARYIAAFCLLHGAHPGAIPFLLEHRHDADEGVRTEAVEAMETRLPREKAVAMLGEMKDDKDPGVRERVEMALKKLGGG